MIARAVGHARSATFRIVTFIFLLQLISWAVLLGYVEWSARQEFVREQQAYVTELQDDLTETYSEAGPDRLARFIQGRIGTGRWADSVVLLTDRAGRRLAGNLRAWPPVVTAPSRWREIDLYLSGSRAPQRIGVTTIRLAGGERLLTGWVLEDDLRLWRTFEEAMLAALLVAAPLALLVAAGLGRVIGRRLDAVSGTAAAISAGDLSQRVPRDHSEDPFDTLAAAINAMLDRIESLVGELSLVTDSLAHDLLSPLTRVRAALEEAHRNSTDPANETALRHAERDLQLLMGTLSTALQISRAEAGIGREQLRPACMADLVNDIAELYRPLVEDRGLTLALHTHMAATIEAPVHRDLLVQALSNLIENALRHAHGASALVLGLELNGSHVHLSVADDGPGIAADRRDEAKQRFVRLDPARRGTGSGLGLALVDSVARLHGGRLELTDAAPGLRATLILPNARQR